MSDTLEDLEELRDDLDKIIADLKDDDDHGKPANDNDKPAGEWKIRSTGGLSNGETRPGYKTSWNARRGSEPLRNPLRNKHIWRWGDRSGDTFEIGHNDPAARHVYEDPGTYQITLFIDGKLQDSFDVLVR